VIVSVLDRDPDLDIRVFLRSHSGILDREALAALIGEAKPPQTSAEKRRRIDPGLVTRRIEVLNNAILYWEQAPQRTDAMPDRFITRRLGRISRNLGRAGLGPGGSLEQIPDLANDPELLTEADVVSRESIFQLQATIQELKQRWPDYEDLSSAPQGSPTEWLRGVADLLDGL